MPAAYADPPPRSAGGRASQLSDFAHRFGVQLGQTFADHTALDAAAIAESSAFWRCLLDWSGVIADDSAEPARIGESVEHATFFPNLALNYAENLLAGDEGAPAIISVQAGRTLRLSRGELRERVRRAAAGLAAFGIGVGDHVAAIAHNDADAVVACLAAATLGAAFCSASPEMPAPAILGRFGQLSPRLLFAHAEDRPGGHFRDTVAAVVAGLPSLRALVTLGEGGGEGAGDVDGHAGGGQALAQGLPCRSLADLERAAPWPEFRRFGFNHPLFVMFSSGTTGAPKCIVHGAGGTLLEHVKELRLHCDLRPGERLFFQTACSWMMWNWQLSALACRAAIVLNDRPVDGPAALWSIVAEHDVHVFGTSPSYLKLCESVGYVPINEHAMPALRSILSTGSVLHDAQYDWVARDVKRVKLQSISGGTDIIGCFVLGHPDLPVARGEAQCRSLGLDVAALRADGTPAAADEIGDLVCRNPFPSRPLGFFGDPDGRRFHDAYFAQHPGVWTHGDRVAFSARGAARLHGRADGMLNVRGIRIGTAEIYAALQDLPDIVDALAVEQDRPDDPAGSRVVLLVMLAAGVALTSELVLRLRRAIARRAGAAHVPGLVLDVPDLPTTHSGKRSEVAARDAVNRRPVRNRDALRNPDCLDRIAAHPGLRADPAARAALATAATTRDKLAAIWAAAFGVDQIGPDEDFFALGGDSLLAVAICTQVEAAFGYRLQMAALLEAPTVAGLARLLDDGIVFQGGSPLVPLRHAPGRPVFLLHSIVGNVFEWHDLVARLNAAERPFPRAVVAVQARGLDPAHPPAASVEQMAADYVALIRARQPAGPYSLLGYSFGGLLAYDIARRLREAGEAVDFLGLIDTEVRDAALPWRERLRFRVGRLRHLGRRVASLGVRGTLGRLRDKSAGLSERPMPGGELPPVLRRVRAACEQAFGLYTPLPGDLAVTYFRSAERRPYFCEPLIVWRRVAASVRVIFVPGTHISMMFEPSVGELAAEIAACLAESGGEGVPVAAERALAEPAAAV